VAVSLKKSLNSKNMTRVANELHSKQLQVKEHVHQLIIPPISWVFSCVARKTAITIARFVGCKDDDASAFVPSVREPGTGLDS
jgi:hypothetical protein